MTTATTKFGKQMGFTALIEADYYGNRYLGDYNERVESGKDDRTAERLYAKGQYWLDRYNRLNGDA